MNLAGVWQFYKNININIGIIVAIQDRRTIKIL